MPASNVSGELTVSGGGFGTGRCSILGAVDFAVGFTDVCVVDVKTVFCDVGVNLGELATSVPMQSVVSHFIVSVIF